LKSQAVIIPGTRIKVVIGISEFDSIATAGTITNEENYIAHIFDGKKLTSSASGNVNIDLRVIAPKIGKILGGSGGGNQKLTQCGGPKKDNVKEALELAKKMTIKLLTKGFKGEKEI
jgi:alanyl-tRNA synthetase